MSVVRLRTRREAKEQLGLQELRGLLCGMDEAGSVPRDLLGRLVGAVERELAARSGWRFVMVEPHLYADVVTYLTRNSRRPLKAVELFARLFSVLPPDGTDIQATRAELGRMVGIRPSEVSEIMGELEATGAVYRKREGRGVRYFVNPRLGTHLTGGVRDRAQAEAPQLTPLEGGKALEPA